MKKRPTLKDFDKQAFRDNKFVASYNKLQPQFDFIEQLIIARKAKKISQAKLAKLMHTKQPAIARFENGGFSRATIATLQGYADALGYVIRIRFVPKKPTIERRTRS